jgi:NNMT/PNMT/TEMT family
MPASLKISPWRTWQADDYYQEYYGADVQPDEREAIRFQVEFLRSTGLTFSSAVEYGCGPTLGRAIAASHYVRSIHMADHLESNLDKVRQWALGDPNAGDWSAFTRYVLVCEGIAHPDATQTQAKEQLTRKRITEFLLTDAKQRYPLGRERIGFYDLLITGFCVDCISTSKVIWRKCMENVFTVLQGGGSFVVAALRRCKGYRVGERWFPACDIDRTDFERALFRSGADPTFLRIEERDLPSHDAQGYYGILLAAGRKQT